eukprot:Gb_01543 [translate_table: standard]
MESQDKSWINSQVKTVQSRVNAWYKDNKSQVNGLVEIASLSLVTMCLHWKFQFFDLSLQKSSPPSLTIFFPQFCSVEGCFHYSNCFEQLNYQEEVQPSTTNHLLSSSSQSTRFQLLNFVQVVGHASFKNPKLQNMNSQGFNSVVSYFQRYAWSATSTFVRPISSPTNTRGCLIFLSLHIPSFLDATFARKRQPSCSVSGDRAPLLCRDCDDPMHAPGTLATKHHRLLAMGIRVVLNEESKGSPQESNPPPKVPPPCKSFLGKFTLSVQIPVV